MLTRERWSLLITEVLHSVNKSRQYYVVSNTSADPREILLLIRNEKILFTRDDTIYSLR